MSLSRILSGFLLIILGEDTIVMQMFYCSRQRFYSGKPFKDNPAAAEGGTPASLPL